VLRNFNPHEFPPVQIQGQRCWSLEVTTWRSYPTKISNSEVYRLKSIRRIQTWDRSLCTSHLFNYRSRMLYLDSISNMRRDKVSIRGIGLQRSHLSSSEIQLLWVLSIAWYCDVQRPIAHITIQTIT
jgi:hypothetical protein